MCRMLAQANASIEESREQTVKIVKDEREQEELKQPPGTFSVCCESVTVNSRKWVESQLFDRLILMFIGMNTVCLAIMHHNQPEQMTFALEIAEYLFTVVFVLEAILKIVGLGPCEYFVQPSNVFDFCITFLSLLSLFELGLSNFTALRTLRIFRVLRVARVLRRFPVVMRYVAL